MSVNSCVKAYRRDGLEFIPHFVDYAMKKRSVIIIIDWLSLLRN